MRKYVVCAICFILLSLSGCRADPDVILKGNEISASEEEAEVFSDGEKSLPEQTEQEERIYVYICGAVQEPGVYDLPPGSRVYQLVEAAGGMSEDADEQSVNLAEIVSDGQMVRIPARGESGNGIEETVSSGISADGKVNINIASEEQLMSLSGIGETKAKQIINYREENGAFPSTEAIMQVSGIGEGTYEKIKNSITVQ